jgi:hypothetical protein
MANIRNSQISANAGRHVSLPSQDDHGTSIQQRDLAAAAVCRFRAKQLMAFFQTIVATHWGWPALPRVFSPNISLIAPFELYTFLCWPQVDAASPTTDVACDKPTTRFAA